MSVTLIERLGKACICLRYLGSRGHSLSYSVEIISVCCTYNLEAAAAAVPCDSAPRSYSYGEPIPMF